MIQTLKRIRKIGNGFYISIPKQYLNDSLLKIDKEYRISIEEVEKEQFEEIENKEKKVGKIIAESMWQN